ncbi:FliM/FliN family flagellar motor switch protein [Parvularcula maris]|uniref:Flagellar motor switch protein FliN n=1 Tax=Parvularcula maris TaxID=2965077 RepID=A0A9X2L6U0_9PROT|nr:FliM/FliN family flagellar motor switch protein [Parvularcula maris]MCQ8184063.1 FliM/FliN family flagellar motor switch protein [Parvularcula maris]
MTSETSPSPLEHLLSDMPVELSVRLGSASMTMADLLALTKGSVLELAESAERPLELCANGSVIARGELGEAEGDRGLFLRITELSGTAEAT